MIRNVSFLWKIAFTFFAIAGVAGLLLRFQFIGSVQGVNYQYILHTHSHIILLGWLFNAIAAALHYITLGSKVSGNYRILFILFQLSVVGMMVSFPIQGYGAISIFFSTLHIVLSYFWVYLSWKKVSMLTGVSAGFIRWGLFYLVVSTIGPFSLGPIISSGGAGSYLYFMAIYFYLHFLYNGAFIFCLLGLLFWLVHQQEITLSPKNAALVLKLMNVSCLAGLFLSTLWMKPHPTIYLIAAAAGVIQLAATTKLVQLIRPQWVSIRSKLTKPAIFFLVLAFSGFLLKAVLQAISAIPFVANLAYDVRNITIGYLHLVFLGVLTPFLFAWFASQGMMQLQSSLKKLGMLLFLIGFVFSEVVIVGQMWLSGRNYYQFLFAASVFLWVGIVLIYPTASQKEITTHKQ